MHAVVSHVSADLVSDANESLLLPTLTTTDTAVPRTRNSITGDSSRCGSVRRSISNRGWEGAVASSGDRIRSVLRPRPGLVNFLLLEQDKRLPVFVPLSVRHFGN